MTAAELFIMQGGGPRHKYIVPIYQRVFTWGDREVSRLICDLHEHFVAKHHGNAEYNDYYLGVITVVEGQKTHEKDFLLVDGQQRLTCLMLLGALLDWPMDYDLLDYECRPQDRAAKDCLKHGRGEKFVTGNPAMDNFFKCANSLRYKDDKGDNKSMVEELRNLNAEIALHIKLFVSVLPADPYRTQMEEQNKYFEKMNAGGRQLEPHEILKVRICSQCKQQQDAFYIWNRATDFSHVYKDDDKDRIAEHRGQRDQNDGLTLLDCFEKGNFKSEPPEPTDGGEERIVNRESIVTLPVYLLHVLALTNENNGLDSGWSEDRLLDAFRDVLTWQDGKAESFVRTMEAYREFLDEYVIHLSYDTNRSVPSYQLDKIEKAEDGDRQSLEQLKLFQEMLYAANGGRQGKHVWLLNYYADKEKTLDSLKRMDKESAPWRGKEKMEEYVDGLCYQNQARWLFWRLDYLLWEKVTNGLVMFNNEDDGENNGMKLDPVDIKIIKNFCFHTGRSIEHLHPRSDGWPESGDEEVRKWNLKNDERTKVMKQAVLNKDMFGNLCLLTPQLNSAVGNESVGVKLARITDKKCELQSIKMLLMYKECEGSDAKWTWDASQKHLRRMKKVLQDSYLADSEVK